MANNQTPIQEAAERLGEGMPGLAMIPKMIATVDFSRREKAHLRHVEDSHRMGMEALRKATGLETEPLEVATDGGEEGSSVGDLFSVAGDTTHNHYYPPADEKPSLAQPATPASEPEWKTWAKRLAIPLAVATGIGGKVAYDKITTPSQPPAVVQPAQPTDYTIRWEETTPGPFDPTGAK